MNTFSIENRVLALKGAASLVFFLHSIVVCLLSEVYEVLPKSSETLNIEREYIIVPTTVRYIVWESVLRGADFTTLKLRIERSVYKGVLAFLRFTE